jgi:hypothetical protein
MAQPKFAQIHKQLLFHWTKPCDSSFPRSSSERLAFIAQLKSILRGGLRFSVPKAVHCENIVPGKIESAHPMICFTETTLGDVDPHARRYGGLGLGFVRRFVIESGGRPVVYVSNKRSDEFRKALLGIVAHSQDQPDPKVSAQARYVASFLKRFRDPQSKKDEPDKQKRILKRQEPDLSKGGLTDENSPPESPGFDDSHLQLKFGGVLGNVEDREWRIVDCSAVRPAPTGDHAVRRCLPVGAGDLALVIFPDHQTLSCAGRDLELRDLLWTRDKPCVCLLSKEMLFSM